MNKVLFHSPCQGAGISTLVANAGVELARSGLPALLGGGCRESIGNHFSSWNPPAINTQQRNFQGIHKLQVENHLYLVDYEYQKQIETSDYQVSVNLLDQVSSQTNEFLLLESTDKSLPDLSVLNMIDWLVIVITPEEGSFAELAKLINQLCGIERLTPRLKTLVVLNKYDPASQICRDVFRLLQASLAVNMFKDPLLLDESVKEALACGLPLAEHAPYSPLIHTLNTLAQYFIKWEENTHAAA